MRCRLTRTLAMTATLLLLVTPAVAASSLLIQNVDTTAYPTVTFTVVVPPGVVSGDGQVPSIVLFENGAEIKDVGVASLVEERRPIDVVLLIDTSGSMQGGPLADAKSAARRFIESMEPNDRIAVVSFASQPTVQQEFTSDRGRLAAVIDGLVASGETALYDGLVKAASLVGASPATERYVVALSDGGDTLSINSPDNAARALKDAKAPVYAVALESPEYNPLTLETIARTSGGKLTSVKDSGSLLTLYESIAEEMQLRYRVEYRSTRPSTPELDIVVRLGAAEDGLEARAAVRNPRFEASGGLAPAPFVEPQPSIAAFGLSIVFAFVAATVFVVALGLIFKRDRAALDQLAYYDQLHETASTGRAATDLTTTRGRILDFLGDLADKRGFTGLVQRKLESAGMALRANEYILFHVLLTIVIGLVLYVLAGGWLLTVTGVLVVVALPIVLLELRAGRRRNALEEQLPDILNLIAGSMRSGWGIQQAIDLVVDEVDDPSKTEFRRVQAETRLGLPLEDALHRMAERVDSEDLRWTVAAITIQREVGGNLAEVLNTVARTIRERAELRREVKALTAEGRLSAVVLTALPFVIFFMLFAVNAPYMLQMLETGMGRGALLLGGALLLVGTVWLNRVMKIEV